MVLSRWVHTWNRKVRSYFSCWKIVCKFLSKKLLDTHLKKSALRSEKLYWISVITWICHLNFYNTFFVHIPPHWGLSFTTLHPCRLHILYFHSITPWLSMVATNVRLDSNFTNGIIPMMDLRSSMHERFQCIKLCTRGSRFHRNDSRERLKLEHK